MNEEKPTTLAAPQNSAVALIREAMTAGASPEYLGQLLAVRREWEADEARKAFNLAISEFQKNAPIIEKADKAHNKEYARMDRIWRDIRPLLTGLGLSITWQVCELRDGNLCHVEGQLRHRDGHGERLVQDIPLPDIVSGQNKAQQMGSASTYAKRYATVSGLGLVTGDDDDGHMAGISFVTVEQAKEIGDLVCACRETGSFNETAFWAWANATAPMQIQADRFSQITEKLKSKLGGKK